MIINVQGMQCHPATAGPGKRGRYSSSAEVALCVLRNVSACCHVETHMLVGKWALGVCSLKREELKGLLKVFLL